MKKIRIMMIFVIFGFIIFNGIVYYFSVDTSISNEKLADDISKYKKICKDTGVYDLLIKDGDIINSDNDELIDKKNFLMDTVNDLSNKIDRLNLEIEKLS